MPALRGREDATTYALLIVALLERGGPMTLDEVARRFEDAGVAPATDALAALKRCRPARPPVYRDGEQYALDPYDDELDLWAFRLGLRPPAPRPARPSPPPRPNPDCKLAIAELDEAWRNQSLLTWSAQRIATAVLDAHGRAMTGDEVVAFVAARTNMHRLYAQPSPFHASGRAVAVADDGTWSIVPGAPELVMARNAVRDAIDKVRRCAGPSREELAESMRAYESRRAAHAAELAALRRVIVHAFPVRNPRVVVFADVEERQVATMIEPERSDVESALRCFDVIGGIDVRGILRGLGITTDRRLAELGPPQKSIRLSASRTLDITVDMLIRGSCHINRPLHDPERLRGYLAGNELAKLARCLEAESKAILAYHDYGRLHGFVRLRSAGLDATFSAPWHHHDEPTLHVMMKQAYDLSMRIEAVLGAPEWADPWTRVASLDIERGAREHELYLVDEHGYIVDDRDVQLARLEASIH